MKLRLDLGKGSYVEVEPDVQELDRVMVIKPSGARMPVYWGSVIAMTNGDAIRLLQDAKS